MSRENEFDAFAEIYDVWVSSAEPTTSKNLKFYTEAYLKTQGLVVELGIGNGRIAINAAQQGKAITGVESSPKMLQLCEKKAKEAGVASLINNIKSDFRDFILPEPAELISIPFHSIGHLVLLEEKQAALNHIYTQLKPGGKLILDHFIFNLTVAQKNSAPQLRTEFTHPQSGHDMLLWVYSVYEPKQQKIRIISWTEKLDSKGIVIQKKYHRAPFSWITIEQMRDLLEKSGFKISATYGDFDRNPLTENSQSQIWIAEK